MARILVIEDEPDIRQLLRWNLEKDGHTVRTADTGSAGLHELRREPWDLVLLDLMLPDRDGLEVCKVIRADETLGSIPIIMVTAKGEESDIVLGLGLGADDYLVKPFRIKELLARVRVRLARRTGDEADAERKRLQAGPLTIDPVRYRVMAGETAIPLTRTEFKILHHLAAHPGVVYGRYDLLDHIGDGESVVTDRTVDAHIRNLRRKLGPHADVVDTVRGVGYRWNELAR